MKIHWLSGKEKVLGTVKNMLIAFWDIKGHFTIDFLEKSVTVNGASNCWPLMQNSPYLLNHPFIYIYIYRTMKIDITSSNPYPHLK